MALELHKKKRQRGHPRMPSNMIEDPFSSTQMDIFDHMNRTMSRFDTMMNDMFSSVLAPFPSTSNRRAQLHSERSFPFGFSDTDAFASSPNCHMYSTSQITSMAVGPDGRPQVYQASTSTKALPGGIRETKKTLCDSRSGVKKMSLGHHIGERGRVIERQKNLYSGEEEEHQEFININEEEAECFDREFEHRIMNGKHALPATPPVRSSGNRPKGNTEALPLSSHRSNGAVSQLHGSQMPSRKANKGIIKGALRKVRK